MIRALVFNIGLDDIVGDVATAATKVTTSPHVAAQKRFSKMGKFAEQLMRTFPFQPLNQTANRYLRRYRDQQMHMVFGYMPFQYLNFLHSTYFSNQITYPSPHFSSENGPPILGDPNQVQVNGKNAVRTMPILSHILRLAHNAKAVA